MRVVSGDKMEGINKLITMLCPKLWKSDSDVDLRHRWLFVLVDRTGNDTVMFTGTTAYFLNNGEVTPGRATLQEYVTGYPCTSSRPSDPALLLS